MIVACCCHSRAHQQSAAQQAGCMRTETIAPEIPDYAAGAGKKLGTLRALTMAGSAMREADKGAPASSQNDPLPNSGTRSTTPTNTRYSLRGVSHPTSIAPYKKYLMAQCDPKPLFELSNCGRSDNDE
jgi:hypothetical protein